MDSSLLSKIKKRQKRALRTRKHLRGTVEKPRLCVFRSNRHVIVQLIDDAAHQTIVSASTLSKVHRNTEGGRKSKDAAKNLGMHIATVALEKNIKNVIFDRGPYKYHGVVAAVAEGAREGGLVL